MSHYIILIKIEIEISVNINIYDLIISNDMRESF